MKRMFALATGLLLGCVTGYALESDAVPADFRLRCATLANQAEANGALAVPGRDGWFFLTGELRHLGTGLFWGEAAVKASRATDLQWADPLPAIADFHDQLAKRGVRLLLVPVPPKAVIYPDGLPDSTDRGAPAERPDRDLQAFYGHLRLKGIKVLDLTAAFLKHRKAGGEPLYCRQDSHWSGVACALAAKEIGMELFATFDGEAKQNFTGSWEQVAISGDLWRSLAEPRPEREMLRLRRVSTANGHPVEPDRQSPVVLLGDSHCLVFHAGADLLASASGLPDQLALELGFPVDLVAVRGSGATAARINLLRRAQSDSAYWPGKRWVVWCFGAREFTEAEGWRSLPVSPQDSE